MNQYQQEVADIDKRHRVMVRGLALAGAAALAAAALWAADLPLLEWWNAFGARTTADARPVNPTPTASSSPGAVPATATTGTQTLAGNDSSVSSTPQRLLLISTTPGRNSHEGVARIGTIPQNPQTYVAGAILVNGSRLVEIHSDRVVLARGNERVTLFVAAHDNAGREKPAQGSIDLATVPAMSASPAQPEPLRGDAFGEVIRSMAYYENDQLQGLQVFPGRQSGTFARLGLKPADVIVAIDSVAVTDAQNATEYLQGLAQGAVISVSVRRGTALHTLSLDGALFEPESSKTSGLARTFP